MSYMLAISLRCLISRKKEMLAAVIFSLAICCFSFHLLSGEALWWAHNLGHATFTSTIALDFSSSPPNAQEMRKLHDLFSGAGINGTAMKGGYYATLSASEPAVFGFMGGGHNRWYVQNEGRYFTDSEIAAAEQKAVIDSGLYNWDDFDYAGHEIRIAGAPFEIVGLATMESASMIIPYDLYRRISPAAEILESGDSGWHEQPSPEFEQAAYSNRCIEIPYTTYENLGLVPQVAGLRFAFKSDAEKQALCAELGELFPCADIVVPQSMTQRLQPALSSSIKQGMLLTLIPLAYIIALFFAALSGIFFLMRSLYAGGVSCVRIRRLICSLYIAFALSSYALCIVLDALFESLMNRLQLSGALLPWMHICILAFVCAIGLVAIAIVYRSSRLERLLKAGD